MIALEIHVYVLAQVIRVWELALANRDFQWEMNYRNVIEVIIV